MADNIWATCDFLVLDEISMPGCAKIARISKALTKSKSCSLPFGELHVMFCGDFHQLPPIGDRRLYHTCVAAEAPKYSKLAKKGMYLWSQVVQTTVLLSEHYRARHPDVYEVMERVRRGTPTPIDLECIKRRVFGHPNGPDIRDPEWQSAPFITPRNIIRQAWNNQAAIGHTIQTGNQIFISPSIDEGVPYPREAMIWTGDNKTEILATWNVICIGAEAIVTSNISVELNVANGSKVIVKEVVLHPLDHHGWQEIQHNTVVKLSYPPITVFVDIVPISEDPPMEFNYHPHHPTWFPIFPDRQRVKIPREFCLPNVTTFHRTQIPLTLAFSASDFRVQGASLANAILNMKRPPTGQIGLENIYVMLSRITTWDDLSVLQRVPDERLSVYDEFLVQMHMETKCQLAGECG